MNSIEMWFGAMAVAVTATYYPQKSVAQGFTGDQFLQRAEQSQSGYISTQIVMVATITSRIDTDLADCMIK